MKQIFTIFLVIYSLFLTACPLSKATVEKIESANKQVVTYANESVEITRALFQSKLITLEQKDRIADSIIMLAKGGVIFDEQIAKLKAGGTEKPTTQQVLDFFRVNLLSKFVNVLTQLKLISPGEKLRQAIALIETSVLIIAASLNIRSEAKQAIAGA